MHIQDAFDIRQIIMHVSREKGKDRRKRKKNTEHAKRRKECNQKQTICIVNLSHVLVRVWLQLNVIVCP